MLQCVAVCCSMMWCVVVRYSVLQCVAVCCVVLSCSALQGVAVCHICDLNATCGYWGFSTQKKVGLSTLSPKRFVAKF